MWLIVIIVLVGGWFLFSGGSEGVAETEELVEDEAVEVEDAVAVEPVVLEATLEAVGSYTGSGVAESTYVPGSYTHSVSADIGDPAEGKFYEGWLAGGFGFVSTGKMVKEDGKYVLDFESGNDLTSKYGKVVITEETAADGLDGKPEAHVLEGDLE